MQVIPIDHRNLRRALQCLQSCQLFSREPIGLEVGETPVGIAEPGPAGFRPAVGLNRLIAFTQRLECMRQ